MTKNNSPLIQQKRSEMLSRILDTSRAIMRKEGVAALSMQELARRMNMRAPSLYNYFSSKNEIYDALFQLGQRMFEVQISEYITNGDWRTQLSDMMKSYLNFALQNPELYQLCFERPVPGFVPSPESLEISFGILERLYGQVKTWLPLLNTPLNERQLGDFLIAFNHGITALHLANQPDVPVDESRFASLAPAFLTLLDQTWTKKHPIKEKE